MQDGAVWETRRGLGFISRAGRSEAERSGKSGAGGQGLPRRRVTCFWLWPAAPIWKPRFFGLATWAYHLTRDLVLPDDDKLKAARALDLPSAQRPPFVLKGDTLNRGPLLDRVGDD